MTCDNSNGAVCETRETGGVDEHQQTYRDWIAAGLKKPGKGKRKLAQALGLDPSAVTRILDGTRQVKLSEVAKVAAYLGDAPPDFEGLQSTEPEDIPDQATVPLKGHVASGARVHFLPLDDAELDRVPTIAGATPATVALEIRGTSLGELLNRWLVYFDDVKSPVTPDLVGKLCVAWLSDGRVLVKELKRAGNGLYDLLSYAEEPIRAVSVEWAARVKTVVPR